MTHPVLTALGLGDNESGTYLGHGEWSQATGAGVLDLLWRCGGLASLARDARVLRNAALITELLEVRTDALTMAQTV